MIPAGPIPTTAPLLEMEGIDKSFPGVHALGGVDLDLRAGEVLALVGENGAGKSTLIKVLGGAILPDAGRIRIDGREARIRTPLEARHAGVGIIYQEFNLVPGLSARENIFLGQERWRAGFVPRGWEHRRARALFERIGVRIDPETLCRDLSVAQQQVVEIAKALSLEARIIVMDEPSAALTPEEVERLFQIIRELKSQQIGVIYISHRLDEIFAIADRVMVMRDGARVALEPIGQINRERLIERMVGRKLDQEFPKQRIAPGRERLVVKNLCRGSAVRDVSFSVRAGEVVALTGLVGAGRTETLRLLFGADRPDSGTIELDGETLRIRCPRDAIRAGIGLLTEDRKAQGLVLGQSVRENFGVPNLPALTRLGFVNQRRERAAFGQYVDRLRIRIPHQDQLARNLSGGNQQKVVLAKWLERNCDVILFDEPTRGIDVGSKYEIYLLINALAAQGKAILMVSSELPEVLGMADRILVMHEGRITGEIADVGRASQEDVMKLAVR
jgi:ribose transport system ATP-binding protein